MREPSGAISLHHSLEDILYDGYKWGICSSHKAFSLQKITLLVSLNCSFPIVSCMYNNIDLIQVIGYARNMQVYHRVKHWNPQVDRSVVDPRQCMIRSFHLEERWAQGSHRSRPLSLCGLWSADLCTWVMDALYDWRRCNSTPSNSATAFNKGADYTFGHTGITRRPYVTRKPLLHVRQQSSKQAVDM